MFKLLAVAILTFSAASADHPRISWRPFVLGIVPLDAVVAFNNKGVNTYIGRVRFPEDNRIFIGELYDGYNNMEIVLPNGAIRTIYNNLEVLCTDYPEYVYWLDKSRHIHSSEEYTAIGGAQTSHNIVYHIGRTFYKRLWRLGSIVSQYRLYLIDYDESEEKSIDKFEMLVYTNTTIKNL